jgi:predicted RNase H-like HicB family nuclease
MNRSESVTAHEYTFTAVITRDEEDGVYLVSFPAFPDLATYGETVEEARAMAADCLRCHLEGLKKHGVPLPESEHQEPTRTSITLQLA